MLASDHPVVNPINSYPYQLNITDQQGKVSQYFGNSSKTDIISIVSDIGAVVYPEDKSTIFPGNQFLMGGTITVLRAPEITINDWGKDKLYRSFATTVQELLDEKGIDMGNDDKITPALTTQILKGSKIKITRVAVTEVSQNQPIDFKIVNKNDSNLDEGKTSIEQAGKKGVKKLTYRVTRENGAEKSRVLIKTEIVTQPVDQIVHIGTRPAISVPCRYNSTVIAAAIKYSYSANKICNLMMLESHGNPESVNPNGHYGLFQYDPGAFAFDSASAGYGGASIYDPTAQIYAAVWALTHGKAWRW